jgi:hypothetical protein
VTGDVTDDLTLTRARVGAADLVITVCRNDVENVPAAITAAKLSTERGEDWQSRVHVADPAAYELLVERELASSTSDADDGHRLRYFNVIESATRALLSEHPPFRRSGLVDVDRPHIVVLGSGPMALSVIRQAARVWRVVRADDQPLRVTMVDRTADRVVEEFRDVHPVEADVCDLATRPSFVGDAAWLADATRVYVCLDDDEAGLSAAARLQHRAADVPVVLVAQRLREASTSELLAQLGRGTAHDNLRIFAVVDRTHTPELVEDGDYEILARAIHAAYLDEMARQGTSRATERFPAVAPWEELDEVARRASREQARHIDVKLAAIGCRRHPIAPRRDIVRRFEAAEIEGLASLEHRRWMEERTRAGYVYGAERNDDPARGPRTHPDLVPWERLAEARRDLDRETVARIPEFLARVGFDVVRVP